MVKHHLEKAREASLQAVEIYNKPGAHFRSGGYVVLMIIAWTSLFHAIFYRRKQKPWKKGSNKRFVRIDGDPKHWELQECLGEYYLSDTSNPVRKNLEFFIRLRNKIEHRSMPELDAGIFGECQAMLLNFDNLLGDEFGARYRLRESLSFALQLFPASEAWGQAVLKSPALKSATGFVEAFRSSLNADVLADSRFAFKAFLVQVANHDSKDALAIQFVRWDQLTPEQQDSTQRYVAMIKLKEVPVANKDRMKPGEVVAKVQAALGDPKVHRGFGERDRVTLDVHTRAWRHFNVRPEKGAANPSATRAEYCVYDDAHEDYVYTEAWVAFLTKQLRDEAVWAALYPNREASSASDTCEGSTAR
jgi:hypothetical protein